MKSQTCETTGKIKYECPECGDWEYDAITEGSKCRVCWEFENNPETFAISEEEAADWDKSSRYVLEHNITPNLDSPSND